MTTRALEQQCRFGVCGSETLAVRVRAASPLPAWCDRATGGGCGIAEHPNGRLDFRSCFLISRGYRKIVQGDHNVSTTSVLAPPRRSTFVDNEPQATGYPTPEKSLETREHAEAGLKADPDNARLLGLLAYWLASDVLNGWNKAGKGEGERAEKEG